MRAARAGLTALGLLAASVAVPVALAPQAHACSCALPTTEEEAVERLRTVPGVFVGTPVRETGDGDTRTYEFTVREVFAGDFGPRTVVSTSAHGPSCGTGFEVNTEQLVLVTDRRDPWGPDGGGPWYADMCLSGQATVHPPSPVVQPARSERELVVEALGQPHAPAGAAVAVGDYVEGAATRPVFVLGGVALLVVIAWAVRRVWRSRRS